MLSIIPLPANFVPSTTSMMAEILGDLSPYIILVLSIIAVAVIIEIIIGALRK